MTMGRTSVAFEAFSAQTAAEPGTERENGGVEPCLSRFLLVSGVVSTTPAVRGVHAGGVERCPGNVSPDVRSSSDIRPGSFRSASGVRSVSGITHDSGFGSCSGVYAWFRFQTCFGVWSASCMKPGSGIRSGSDKTRCVPADIRSRSHQIRHAF